MLSSNQQLEAPMANWFNSVPNSFDTVAYALRVSPSRLQSAQELLHIIDI